MNLKKTKFVRTAALAMLALLTSAFASAQDSSSSVPQDGDSAPPITKAVDSSNPLGGPPKPAGRTYMALGSDLLFSLDATLKSQILFQMDLTEGYDDGIILVPTRTGVYYTLWTPRIALLGRTPKSEYVIQYTPKVSYFANTPIGVQALHEVSAEQHRQVNSYWGWDTSLSVANGSYPVSLLGGFNFFAIDNIAAVNIDSILLLSATSYFNLNASVDLHWTPTPRDAFVLSTDLQLRELSAKRRSRKRSRSHPSRHSSGRLHSFSFSPSESTGKRQCSPCFWSIRLHNIWRPVRRDLQDPSRHSAFRDGRP